MKTIDPRHKDIIVQMIREKYPKFVPDCWGRIEVEDALPHDAGFETTYAIAGRDGEERRYFDCSLIVHGFGTDVSWLHEAKPIYKRESFFRFA